MGERGFFPKGAGAIFSAIVGVIFSMVGAEIATIAAAESPDPARAVRKATNSVITRISLFFVGSVFLLAVIVPWNSNRLGSSPFVTALGIMGIPAAANLMNAVVLTAVLSCLNTGLYTASRMLFVLTARREAPVSLIRVTKRGVPQTAILASSVVGFLCVMAAAFYPNTIFLFLLNSSGAIILFVYLLICLAQIVLRRRTPPEALLVKMRLFPTLSIITTLGILGVLIQMAMTKSVRSQLLLSLAAWAVVVILYFVTKWRGGSVEPEERQPEHSGAAAGARASQRDRRRGRTARRTAPDRPCRTRELLRLRPGQPGGHRAGGARRPVYIWEATVEAAQQRLDYMLGVLRSENLDVSGALGDYRPLRALADAVAGFHPDELVISTLPHQSPPGSGTTSSTGPVPPTTSPCPMSFPRLRSRLRSSHDRSLHEAIRAREEVDHRWGSPPTRAVPPPCTWARCCPLGKRPPGRPPVPLRNASGGVGLRSGQAKSYLFVHWVQRERWPYLPVTEILAV